MRNKSHSYWALFLLLIFSFNALLIGQLIKKTPLKIISRADLPPQTINLEINSPTGKQISPELFIYQQSFTNLNGNINRYKQAIAETGVGYLRFPAGCDADAYDWRNNDYTIPNRNPGISLADNLHNIKTGPNPLNDLYVLNTFSFPFFSDNANNYTCGYSLYKSPFSNPEDVTEDLVDLLEYLDFPAGTDLNNNASSGASLRQQQGYPDPLGINYFEIGNEHWGLPTWYNCRYKPTEAEKVNCWNYFMTGNDQDPTTGMADITGLIAKTIKQYLPNAYVIAQGPAVGEIPEAIPIWRDKMLADENIQQYVDGFQLHFYYFSGGNGQAIIWFESDFIPTFLESQINYYQQNNQDFWVTEYNLKCWDPNHNPATGTLENGLFTLDVLRYLALKGVKGAVFQHAFHTVNPNECGAIFSNNWWDFQKRIGGLSYQLFSLMQPEIISADQSPDLNQVYIMASTNSAKSLATLLVINNNSTPKIININLDNFMVSNASYSVLDDQGGGFADFDYQLNQDQAFQFTGQYQFTAHSATVLKFNGAMSPTLTPTTSPTLTPMATPTHIPSIKPNNTPYPTNTPSPTTTPTPTPLPSPTPTIPPTTTGVKIRLQLKFDGINQLKQDQKISLKIQKDNRLLQTLENLNLSADNQGIYRSQMIDLDIPADHDYNFLIKGQRHLQLKFTSLNLIEGENNLDLTSRSLPTGDLPIPQNGIINSQDAVYLVNCLSKETDDCLTKADLNLDGVINSMDINLLTNSLNNNHWEDEE